MNDQPTDQEIKAFEKANPQLAAPKEISSNWITAGFVALGLVTAWMWAWWKKITKKGGDV